MLPSTVIDVPASRYTAPPPAPPAPPCAAPASAPSWPLHPPRTNVRPSSEPETPLLGTAAPTESRLSPPFPPLPSVIVVNDPPPPPPAPVVAVPLSGGVPAEQLVKFAPAPGFAAVRLLETSSVPPILIVSVASSISGNEPVAVT